MQFNSQEQFYYEKKSRGKMKQNPSDDKFFEKNKLIVKC